jgi:serine protease Do
MRRAVFIVLLLFLLVLGTQRCTNLQELTTRRGTSDKFTPADGPKLDLKDVQVLAALDSEYTKLVNTVMPSVVAITTLGRVRVPQVVSPMDYFFGRRGRTAEQTRSGLGSGVIVSKEGHILTNHHVVEGMEEIRVQLNDGRIEPAKLVGSDPRVDIAVLKIDVGNITPLPFGESDELRVGQMVFAVGNPFGLQETVTQGIISAKGRAISDTGPELLQTDAAVNPGNSGGPLLNLRGEIIGINSAIYSRTGSWAGISFAIPSTTARRTMEAILENRPPSQGYLGVYMMDLNPMLAKELGLPDTRGVLVAEVMGDSPAQKAGLQNGDVIRQLSGRAVNNSLELRRRLLEMQVGSKAELVVLRGGQEVKLTAELAEPPTDVSTLQTPQAPQPPQQTFPPQSRNNGQRGVPPQQQASPQGLLAGIAVAEITPQIRQALPETVRGGVIVAQVSPDSPASERLRVGDVIEEVNQEAVASVQDFNRAVAAIPRGGRALLMVCRGRTRSFVVIAP